MRILGCLSVILGLTSGVALAEPHRQHAPHEHGHGMLNLAIDGKKMVLHLTAPSQDIVGFEHAATTQSQQAAVHHARAALSSPAELFTLSTAAECAFQHQSIRIGNDPAPVSDEAGHHEEHGEEHGEEHYGDYHEDEAHADHHKNEARDDIHAAEKDGHPESHGDHEDEGAVHSEVEVEYQLTCEKPDALREIGFPYFKRFPNAEELTITAIGPMGQTGGEVSKDNPLFKLH